MRTLAGAVEVPGPAGMRGSVRYSGARACRDRGGTKAEAAAALQATAVGTRGRAEMRGSRGMREEQRAKQSKGGEN